MVVCLSSQIGREINCHAGITCSVKHMLKRNDATEDTRTGHCDV